MWKRVPFGRSASEPSFERSEPPGLIRGRPNRSNAKAGTGALAVPAGTARRVRLSRSRRTENRPTRRWAASTRRTRQRQGRRFGRISRRDGPESRRGRKLRCARWWMRAFPWRVDGTAGRCGAAREDLQCQRPQGRAESSARRSKDHTPWAKAGDERRFQAGFPYREWRESTVKVVDYSSTVDPPLDPGATPPR